MTKIELIGDIKDGKLHIINERRFKEDLRQFKDCQVEIIIKKRGRRSSQQNRYYWGIVVKEIQLRLEELGTEVEMEDVHSYLKQKFNAERIVTPEAELIEIGKTTTELNKEEFGIYIDKVVEWASSVLEIYIPPPNTQTQIFQP